MNALDANEFHATFDVRLPPRPYPGLRAFEKEEWPIFFGRERMADAVIKRLIADGLLVMHGDSGCGKSSLIRAGVLPKLEQECARGGIRWRTCTAFPKDTPLWNVSCALASLDDRGQAESRALEFRRAFNFGPDGPQAVAHLLHCREDQHVCMLIDQFEELFAHARREGPEEARLLTSFLNAMFAKPPPGLYVALTMRSEFLGACARYQGFAETVNATQYLLPRMEREDLHRAIREPAMLFGGEVSRELTERLINDTGGCQDELPLIQHGLMLLCRDLAGDASGCVVSVETSVDPQHPAWRLGLEQYPKATGLSGLLSAHADCVMNKAMAAAKLDAGSRVVEDLFRTLTDTNADGQAVRRPQRFGRLCKVVGTDPATLQVVVAAFRAEGVSFLQPYGSDSIGDDTQIDISHEALLRCWRHLAEPKDGWLTREFRNGLVWRSLLVQADSYERDCSNILSPAAAVERRVWLRRRNEDWAERYGGGWKRVQDLVLASLQARDREQRRQWARWVVGAAGILCAIGGMAYARVQSAEEEDPRQIEILELTRRRSEDLERQNQALRQQIKIDGDGGPPSVPTGSEPSTGSNTALAPRVYIQFAEEKQRDRVDKLSTLLMASELDRIKVVVPEIERVVSAPSRTILRCFRSEECAAEGPRLVQMMNGFLQKPTIVLEDQSARYAKAKIRARHYELWFGPGEVRLR